MRWLHRSLITGSSAARTRGILPSCDVYHIAAGLGQYDTRHAPLSACSVIRPSHYGQIAIVMTIPMDAISPPCDAPVALQPDT